MNVVLCLFYCKGMGYVVDGVFGIIVGSGRGSLFIEVSICCMCDEYKLE